MLRHGYQLKVTSVTLEVAFLWLLGLIAGSFALLQGARQPIPLPQLSLQLGYGVQTLLLPDPLPQGMAVNRIWLGGVAVLAWLCLTAGTARLCQLVSRVYRSSAALRPRWVALVLNVLLTLMLLLLVNLSLAWLGPEHLTPTAVEDLRLQTAEGSPVEPTWPAALWYFARWPATLGVVGLGLASIYRLSPQRWVQGAPLWPGTGLVLMLGSMGLAIGLWGMHQITTQGVAYGVLLVLAMVLLLMYGLILLVPLGAQFNVSLVNQGAVVITSNNTPRLTAPPPSFESFKINRGQTDKFPRE